MPTHITLADYLDVPPDVYPVGRLDRDSEGLLLLSNDKSVVQRLMDPKSKLPKTYLVQVDGAVTSQAISQLCAGVEIKLPNKKMYRTQHCKVMQVECPDLPDRDPPVRYRKDIPTSWLEITITEGKNRQVRKMCAKVGYPVLRLVRLRVGNHSLDGLAVGESRQVEGF